MSRYPILNICARVEGHKGQRRRLGEYCREVNDWEGLLQQAEREGMTPLLRKHLIESGSLFPSSVRRSLNILAKRHRVKAEVRAAILPEILALLQENKLTPILIKGAALCYTTYPDPSLRPMRDMDILLHPEEVDTAQNILKDNGFSPSRAPIPADHYHLPSLLKTVDGMNVCIELHRGLYPNCPPYYPEVHFAELLSSAKKFQIDETEILTFNNEETLHYLYQHAFRAPLTYEPYKLINAADIISFVEKNYATLNWHKVRKQFPLLYKILPLMHHISPWNFNIIPKNFVSSRDRKRRLTPAPYIGWPQKKLRQLKIEDKKWYQILLDTFLPPSWWLGVYYGAITPRKRLLCLLQKHPCHIMWWKRLYSALR